MFDGAPPPPDKLAQLWQAGYRVAGVYVGGPNLYVPDMWHASDVAAARSQGFSIVAFYVGAGTSPYLPGNPDELGAAQIAGLQPGDVYCLDVEGGAPATPAQQNAFSFAVRGAHFRSGLYGLTSTTNGNWASFDCVIGANYPGSSTPPSTTVAPGSVAQVPQGWQWRNTFTEPFSGWTIDASVVDDWFKGEDMTWDMNMKRVAVWSLRGRLEPWPPSQSAIDAYASQIADDGSNFEQIYTNILNDWHAGGGKLIADRVTALEQEVATLQANPDNDSALAAQLTDIQNKLAAVKASL